MGLIPARPSTLALGCEVLGGTDWGPVDLREAHRAVRCALERGITVFDTADAYGLGRGEEELARALGNDRHRVTIVTKGGIRWTTPTAGGRAATARDASPDHLRKAIAGSLMRLGVEVIPLYLVHWPDASVPLEDTLGCLEQERAAGHIMRYGLSNHSLPAVRAACATSQLAAVEGPLSLISPPEQLREYAVGRELGLLVLTYGALAQGLLSGKYSSESKFDSDDRRSRLAHFSPAAWHTYRPILSTLASVSEEAGRPAAQVAIRWVMETGLVDSVVVGARTVKQVQQNLETLSWKLDPAHRQVLDDAREVAEGLRVASPTGSVRP